MQRMLFPLQSVKFHTPITLYFFILKSSRFLNSIMFSFCKLDLIRQLAYARWPNSIPWETVDLRTIALRWTLLYCVSVS